jgi:hypothetical protein
MKTTVHFIAVVEYEDRYEVKPLKAELGDDIDPDDRPAVLRFLTVLVTNLLAPAVIAVLEILVDHFTHH